MIKEINITKAKQAQIRIEENLTSRLKEEAKEHKMSLSSYVNILLKSIHGKEESKKEVLFKEKIESSAKKEVESRVYFTKS